MGISPAEQAALAGAEAGERRVRPWKRYRALRLLAEGLGPAAVTTGVRCSERSVWYWLAAWRQRGLAGLVEAPRGWRKRALDGSAERHLAELLASDPQVRWQ